MAIFKCKMCGGGLEITEGATVCECEYCGTQQTLPKTNDEQSLNMLNRANHFRQQCEFDKALEVYENLLDSINNDPEIYWQIVLCRYGIEYVDDTVTGKKIPTCHRMQFKSILEDADYLEALSHADPQQKELYKSEAEYIDSVQKGILEISNKEEPFDVFICYKESDENGKRTPDSVLAQDLYYQLEREGLKAFFSRITLEGKLGSAYEPYIFAALNSAKVMVVVGTKPKYFNSVWVKNEWSRYLMLMQEDKSRTLIPAYKDMDPYDLPDALSMFQAQDMSKLGFMQDLIHGINKIAKSASKQIVIEETSVNSKNTTTTPLVKRAFMFLEDSEWKKADECCEKILDIEPECAEAYLGKLMAELQVNYKRKLSEVKMPFVNNHNYKKALKYADEKLKSILLNYSENANETAYQQAITEYNNRNYSQAANIFQQFSNYKDSVKLYNECCIRIDEAEIKRKDEILKKAQAAIFHDSISEIEESVKELSTIKNWKNVNELLESCEIILNPSKHESTISNKNNGQDSDNETLLNKIMGYISGILMLILLNWLVKKFVGLDLINIALEFVKKILNN